MPRQLLIRSLPLLLIVLPLAAPAQSEDEIDDWFLKAENAFKRGRDRKGVGFVEKVLKAVPDDVEALALAIEPAVNIGRYDAALEWSDALLAARPEDRAVRVQNAEILFLRGRVEAAEKVLQPLLGTKAEPPANRPAIDFEARALLAKMRLARGRRDDADALYDSLVTEAKRVIIREPRHLVALAEAYAFYRGLREAEKVLADAQKAARKKAPVDPRPSLALGDLYLEKFYLPGDAAEEFKEALKFRPRLSAANWGLYRAYTAWQKGAQASTARRAALATNPHNPDALAAKASGQLGDMLVDQAQKSLDAAFAVDPSHRTALALQSLLHLFAGDRARSDSAWESLMAVDPRYATGHIEISAVLNQRRRWSEALERCRLATKLDAEDPEAWDSLARYAFFLGIEEEGREALRQADKVDKFSHPWRRNMFEVFRVIGEYYREFETRRYVHRVHQRELEAFKPYLVPFCRESWAILTKKYGFDPPGLVHKPGKVLVEWFADHGDFSVRTLGFTHLGATGVCFGPFIGMNSPGSRKPGEFSWARTFHHELAHTMTVGLSKGRTPRWLTEGLSTWEEKCFEPSWDRGLYRELHTALANDDLCKVLTFDSNFAGPRVIFAYFQGGLQCEWMAETFGMDKIIAMLKAYGEDRTSKDILENVLGIAPEAFDAGFKEWVSKRMAPVKLLPRISPKRVSELELALKGAPDDGDTLVELAVAYYGNKNMLDAQEMIFRARRAKATDPRLSLIEGFIAVGAQGFKKAKAKFGEAIAAGLDDHDMRVALARIAERDGDEAAAVTHWTKAIETFPMLGGAADPRLQLARLAEGAGDVDGAMKWLEAHIALSYEDLATRKKLVNMYRLREDKESMRRHLVAMINVYPLDKSVHVGLGELYLKEQKGETAVTEFEVALALQQGEPEEERNPAEEAGIRVQLGNALLLDEEGLDEAERQAKTALELVPGHAGARTLLRAVEAARQGDGDQR